MGGGGLPHPVLDRGVPHPVLDWGGVTPSSLGMGGTPSSSPGTWDGVIPPPLSAVYPPVLDLGWGNTPLSAVWGTPAWIWDGVPPPGPGMGYPPPGSGMG